VRVCVPAALYIQHTERMCHILIRGLTASNIYTLPHIPHDFGGKKVQNIKRVF